jgi:hypothetical protein
MDSSSSTTIIFFSAISKTSVHSSIEQILCQVEAPGPGRIGGERGELPRPYQECLQSVKFVYRG